MQLENNLIIQSAYVPIITMPYVVKNYVVNSQSLVLS